MINRRMVDTIKEAIKHYPVILLTGPRQIGKSTLLHNWIKEKTYSYVSFDDKLELAMAKSDPKTFLSLHKAPLIIDEAQKAPELFPVIEMIVNESRLKIGNKESNGMYILSGSQRRQLLDDSKESLSGRVAILDMMNLSMSEIISRKSRVFDTNILELSNRTNDIELNENEIFRYIVRGFFPGLYDDKDLNTSLFYSSYLTTYLEKDLKDLIDIKDEYKFIEFLKILASNTGEELVYDNYAKQVGVSTNTIKSWVSVLVKTAVIYLVEPYNEESIVKRVVRRPKMYFFDTGLAAYLCAIDSGETLQRSFLKGRFFETFVFNEIKKSFMNEGLMQQLYYYRDSEQNEIDLVLVKDASISLIEIKSGQEFNASSTKAFKKLADSKLIKKNNAIICTASKISILNDGTYIIPVVTI